MALSKILENSITDGVISAAKLKDFAAAVDLNGVELILDADQDTSITADTDDQIDIKISGADDFRFTANTFTALAGSGIVVPDGGLTLGSTAVSSTAAELNILDDATITTAELNLIDGGTARGTTAVADADGLLHNDGGTMRMTSAATFKTYFQEGISQAYDDFTVGDAAFSVSTTAGNITIDAQGNDTDIIFKGTDGNADTTFLTIDGSAAGAATFNDKIIATELDISGNVDVDGTLEADAITIDGTAIAAAGTSSIVTVGALNSGSIATGFGAIDNGASNITTGGLLKLDVDADANDVTGDSATGRLTLGAGEDLNLYHGGTDSYIVNDTGDLVIKNGASDEDILFQGNDGGGAITALTLDMSAAGAAGFNGVVTANAGVVVDNITIDGTEIDLSSGDLTLDVAGTIILDADGGDVRMKDGGTDYVNFVKNGNNTEIKVQVSDGDMLFKGIDGGSDVTALTLDMSAAGAATFNSTLTTAAKGLAEASLPAGTVVQFAADADSAQIASSGTSFVDTNLSIDFTPKFSDSLIVVQAIALINVAGASNQHGQAEVQIVHDGSVLGEAMRWMTGYGGTEALLVGPCSCWQWHTQGNTDAENYKVQFRLVQSLGSVTYNPYAGISNLFIWEIRV